MGSTAVPGLAAKPVIDIDLTVAGPDCEQDYVPALETIVFRLVIREPWWYRHRMLVADESRCNLHVFGCESPEPVTVMSAARARRLREADLTYPGWGQPRACSRLAATTCTAP